MLLQSQSRQRTLLGTLAHTHTYTSQFRHVKRLPEAVKAIYEVTSSTPGTLINLISVDVRLRCRQNLLTQARANQIHAVRSLSFEDVWGSGRIDPHFLDLGTSWR
jgi:hypothetical protein